MIETQTAHQRTPRRLERVRGVALALCLCTGLSSASFALSAPEAFPEVALESLPKEAREVMARIAKGGAFRYSRDGVVFGNREKFLPAKPRGYYHEYTVPTPGSRDRGARRIVCGGSAAKPAACYYSDDHYQSFRRIAQ